MAVLNNFCSRLRENGDYFFNNWSCASGVFAGLQLGSNLLGQFGGTFDKAGLAVGLLVKVLTKVALVALGNFWAVWSNYFLDCFIRDGLDENR